MRIYSKTDTGLVRSQNQDACFADMLSPYAVYAVVCDGMGGANGGNIASKKAVEIIKNYIEKSFKDNLSEKDIIRLLQNAVLSANIELYKMSVKSRELRGMGTTAVVCIATPSRAVICHAGDSRAYIIGKEVRQITRDHSVVQTLVESGKITAEQAKQHPKKNIITRALGVEENIISDINCVDFAENEHLLLCSDGLSNYVSNEFIKETFADTSGEKDFAEILVSRANQNGGGDNITAVVISNLKKGEDDNG